MSSPRRRAHTRAATWSLPCQSCSWISTSPRRGASGIASPRLATIKAWMGATHFLMKRLPRVSAEMALHVLAYNLTRVMNIMGPSRLPAALRA